MSCINTPCAQSPAIYLDANATEILRPAARQAAILAMEQTGNPSSVHFYGRAARRLLEEARKTISAAFGRDTDACVFTSCGTEADVLAVHALGCHMGRRVLVGATEHEAIRASTRGAEVLPVDEQGLLRLDMLEDALKQGGPALICVMSANNETGVISPLEDIAALCRLYDSFLHCDAVQSCGRGALPLQDFRNVSFAISGHKMGGLKGAGALVLPQDMPVSPMMPGGGQERGRRGGTPGLPAIASMAAALEESQKQNWGRIEALRNQLEFAMRSAGAEIMGQNVARLPNTICAVMPKMDARIQLMKLDMAGFCVSAGSACSSGKMEPSHVLEAMQQKDKAGQAIRVSLPWTIRQEEVEAFAEAYCAICR